jgi:tetratricopeptide (TPR) repeat protein
MANANANGLPAPSPEHRRVAAGQFEHANQVIATRKNYDYGIRLLLSCCKLDPGNLIYRQTLRRTQRAKYNNNMKGGWLAWLRTWPIKARVKSALRKGDNVLALEHAERVLVRNPWDVGAQMDLAAAADALGLLDVAIWTLEQARPKEPRNPVLNRTLAELYERRGNFTQAIALWEMVRKVLPADIEAEHKVKDLAASDTIARGHYEEAIGTAGEQEAKAATPNANPPTNAEEAKPVVKTTASATHRLLHEVETLRERLKADPTNSNSWLQLAAVYRRADQLEQARTVLMEGLGPTGNSFHLTLELTDLDLEPFRRDLTIAEGKLKAQPTNSELNQLCYRLYKEINTRELELHRMKADRFPTEMVHRFEVGVRLLRLGQIDEAIAELQTARTDSRLHWQTALYLGHCFKSRNNWRLAKRNFEEALRNLPPNEKERRKELHFLIAEGCAANGQLETAVEIGHELANEDFGYRDIGRLLDEWQARIQQEKAVK